MHLFGSQYVGKLTHSKVYGFMFINISSDELTAKITEFGERYFCIIEEVLDQRLNREALYVNQYMATIRLRAEYASSRIKKEIS